MSSGFIAASLSGAGAFARSLNEDPRCDRSQKGWFFDSPHRQSATRGAATNRSPCLSRTSSSPRTINGPFGNGTTVVRSGTSSCGPPSSRSYRSAPVGQPSTAAATVSVDAIERSTQGRRDGSNVPSPSRMQCAVWMHSEESHDTRIDSSSYTRFATAPR